MELAWIRKWGNLQALITQLILANMQPGKFLDFSKVSTSFPIKQWGCSGAGGRCIHITRGGILADAMGLGKVSRPLKI